MTVHLDSKKRKHRDNGPAVVDGYRKEWWVHGALHRENGPAIEYYYSEDDGLYRAWYISGLRHREDGPAREFPDGRKEYWLFGELIPKEKYTKKLICQMKMTRIIET
jgi:hypothetical protein